VFDGSGAGVWSDKYFGGFLALEIDCRTRDLLGYHLTQSGHATTASNALEHALITRFRSLGRVDWGLILKPDNGQVLHQSAPDRPKAPIWPSARIHHPSLQESGACYAQAY